MAAIGNLTSVLLCTSGVNKGRSEYPRRDDVCDQIAPCTLKFGEGVGGDPRLRVEDIFDQDQVDAYNLFLKNDCDYPSDQQKFGDIKKLFVPLESLVRADEHRDIGHDLTVLGARTMRGVGQKLAELELLSNASYDKCFSKNYEQLHGYVSFIYDSRKTQIVSYVTSPGCKAYWSKNVGVAMKQITTAARFDKKVLTGVPHDANQSWSEETYTDIVRQGVPLIITTEQQDTLAADIATAPATVGFNDATLPEQMFAANTATAPPSDFNEDAGNDQPNGAVNAATTDDSSEYLPVDDDEDLEEYVSTNAESSELGKDVNKKRKRQAVSPRRQAQVKKAVGTHRARKKLLKEVSDVYKEAKALDKDTDPVQVLRYLSIAFAMIAEKKDDDTLWTSLIPSFDKHYKVLWRGMIFLLEDAEKAQKTITDRAEVQVQVAIERIKANAEVEKERINAEVEKELIKANAEVKIKADAELLYGMTWLKEDAEIIMDNAEVVQV